MSSPKICVKVKLHADENQKKILLNLMKENTNWFKYCAKAFINILSSRKHLRQVAKERIYQKRRKFCLQSGIANLTLDDAESHVSSLLNKKWQLKGLLPLRLDKNCCRFEERDGQYYVRIPLRASPEAKTTRMWIPVSVTPKRYYKPLINFLQENTPPSKLIKKGKNFELHVTVPVETIQNKDKPRAVCGIDLNMRKIVAIILAEPDYVVYGKNVCFYSLKGLNQKLNQVGGEKATSQKLIKNEYGNLIKAIFTLTKGYNTTYVIEDLTGIRRNTKNMGRDVNRWLNSHWAYRRFRQMLEQKAQRRGEILVAVDPRGTSSFCYKCGSKGKREKWRFTCLKCGNEMNADLNAAINIAKRSLQKS